MNIFVKKLERALEKISKGKNHSFNIVPNLLIIETDNFFARKVV